MINCGQLLLSFILICVLKVFCVFLWFNNHGGNIRKLRVWNVSFACLVWMTYLKDVKSSSRLSTCSTRAKIFKKPVKGYFSIILLLPVFSRISCLKKKRKNRYLLSLYLQRKKLFLEPVDTSNNCFLAVKRWHSVNTFISHIIIRTVLGAVKQGWINEFS